MGELLKVSSISRTTTSLLILHMVPFQTQIKIICENNRAPENGLVYTEMKWMVALFEWIDRIQSYDNGSDWNYITQLKLFVHRGAKDLKFIDAVSSLVSRGCDGVYCSTQPTPFMEQRRKNFEFLIYNIFDIQSSLKQISSSSSLSSIQPQPRFDYEYTEKYIQSKRSKMESNIFVSKNDALNGNPYYSTAFRFNSFISALRTSSLYGLSGSKVFFLGGATEDVKGFHAGLVNLAAFLANTMVESIRTDSCDEVSWEKNASGQHSISNACGQNGRDYSLEVCPEWQSFMTCNVNPEMEMVAEIPITGEAPFLLTSLPDPFKCSASNETSDSVAGCCFWGRWVFFAL